MSRLGDLIALERTRRQLTPAQVAKLCSVTEKYLMDVESGKRIIGDAQARRILRAIGLREHSEVDFSLDEIASVVDVETLRVAQPPQAPVSGSGAVASGIWLDALAGVLKAVPVYNAAWTQVSRRLLPIENGRIENCTPEKVFYFLTPDDGMCGFRIMAGDLVLMAPAQSPVDDAIMLLEHRRHKVLRKIRNLGAGMVLLQSFGREYAAEPLQSHEIVFLGRAIRIEISLQ